MGQAADERLSRSGPPQVSKVEPDQIQWDGTGPDPREVLDRLLGQAS
jgi:hypothetical protein